MLTITEQNECASVSLKLQERENLSERKCKWKQIFKKYF